MLHDISRRNYLGLFLCESIHVVDRYLYMLPIIGNVLTPRDTTSFCFLLGVRLKLNSRGALKKELKELEW